MAKRAHIPERETVTVLEAARRLGVGHVLVYRAIQRGELPCIRLGHRLLIPKVAFEQLLAGGFLIKSEAAALNP